MEPEQLQNNMLSQKLHPGRLLLTWINFKPISNYNHYEIRNEIIYQSQHFNGNFVVHITGPVITYPCWD